MKTTEKDIELFDSYMNGTMSDTERTQFEERLREDEAYRKEYELHSQIVLGIQRKELKAMLQEQEKEEQKPVRRGLVIKLSSVVALAACLFIGIIIVHNAFKMATLGGDYIAKLEQPVVRGSGVEESLAMIYDDLQQSNYAEAQDNINKARQVLDREQTVINNKVEYSEDSVCQLVELYRDELNKYHTHYVFAVDVSGTMRKYSDTVTKVLQSFIQAIPDDDRVDIIPFGAEALPNMLSYCGVINTDVRSALSSNVINVYTDPSYPVSFRAGTDITQAVKAVIRVLQNNREYNVNVVVLLSDFINERLIPFGNELSDEEINELNAAYAVATNGIYTRCFALELPVVQTASSYCLPQLKERVFHVEGNGLEIVPLANTNEMIVDWFDQQERDIMVNKLKAFVEDANQETEYHQQMLKLDSDELDWYQALVYAKTHKLVKAKRLLRQIAKSDSRYKDDAAAMLK